MSDLVKRSDIYDYLDRGAVESGLAVEDHERERARWNSGYARDLKVVQALDVLADPTAKMVDLYAVIERGGLDLRHRPRLAVAPAGAKEVKVISRRDGSLKYRARRWKLNADHGGWSGEVTSVSATAQTPIAPPDVREQIRKEHLILWEATWVQTYVKRQRPPMRLVLDPAVLEHVAGSLYRVVVTWDLTELEAAALR